MRKRSSGRGPSRSGKTRCAVYTRKSHEEGLEQEFNSLDAQREACEAFIRSQKHEGWLCLPDLYDDGGISGATMERPALQRLLADIEAGRIDTVVVYKVDRLTRSLGDFARIVEVFDRQGVSFVSITQQFNTTTSMGRLTLNMLLSFAQFEREVTGERIRDKIAASKKKGRWMGGLPPLGYDVQDRRLVANPAEAETVRHIFRRYTELGSVHALKEQLDSEGIVSKRRTDRYGHSTGGNPLARGALYRMLQNRIYRGEIGHKGASYPGQHEAIVDQALWDRVQRQLASNRMDCAAGASAAQPSLLAGLVYDEAGQRMTASHANKKGTRYRYYVSQGLVRGGRRDAPSGCRVPAIDLEALVEDRLRQFLADEAALFGVLQQQIPDAGACARTAAEAADLARRWPGLAPVEKRKFLGVLVHRVDLLPESLAIQVWPLRVPGILQKAGEATAPPLPEEGSEPGHTLSVPARLKRTGMQVRLLIDGLVDRARREPDRSLLRLLARAQQYHALVMHSGGRSIAKLAAEAGVSGSYFTRVLRVSFLAPEIVHALLHDRHPIELNAKRLVSKRRVRIAWKEQRDLIRAD